MPLFSRSLLSLQRFAVALILVATAWIRPTADAKVLDVILQILDAPNRVDSFANAPGHFAEKTVEFLAFGDAGTGYYQS